METLKNKFNKLKRNVDFTDCEVEPTMVISILEPSCNMDFVTTVTKITEEGKIYSKQFEDSPEEDWFENDFSDLLNRESKQNVLELLAL